MFKLPPVFYHKTKHNQAAQQGALILSNPSQSPGQVPQRTGKKKESPSCIHMCAYTYAYAHTHTYIHICICRVHMHPTRSVCEEKLDKHKALSFVAGVHSMRVRCFPLPDSVLWWHVLTEVVVPLRFPQSWCKSCCYLHIKYIKMKAYKLLGNLMPSAIP